MKLLTIAVALVVAVGGFAAWNLFLQHRERKHDEAMYADFCERIRKTLKAPRTAIFPALNEADVRFKRRNNNVLDVESYVDSQNSFGAQIRNPWRMVGWILKRSRFCTSSLAIKKWSLQKTLKSALTLETPLPDL